MRIGIGGDHVAVEMKNEIIKQLTAGKIDVIDFGTSTSEMCDYPVYAEKVARAVVSCEVDMGILICGTGLGMCLASNKIKGVRACLCSEPYTAILSRRHNDANILCLGAQVLGTELAKLIVDQWLSAEFEGGNHQRRVQMICELEERERSLKSQGISEA